MIKTAKRYKRKGVSRGSHFFISKPGYYLDKHVFVDDFSVQHFLRQFTHQRVEFIRILSRRQSTKITFQISVIFVFIYVLYFLF